MENFIDEMTPTELVDYYGEKPTPEMMANDRSFFAEDTDRNLAQLFHLFVDRGNRTKAQTYYDRIKDPQIKLDAAMLDGDSRYEKF